MANPNPNTSNLKPFKKGQSGNPLGKKKGTLDLATRIRRIANRKIDWDKINVRDAEGLKKRYGKVCVAEAIVWIAVSKALTGDIPAMNFLHETGWGKTKSYDPQSEQRENVVHIYKPEKLNVEELNMAGRILRERAERRVAEELTANEQPVDLYAPRN